MKKCYLYKKLNSNKIQCQTCAHQCVILPNKKGICGIRANIDWELYLLTYGRAIAENVDPIEKKPFFHFLPGTRSLSVATIGCNFRCDNCQNWDISQMPKQMGLPAEAVAKAGAALPPKKIVKRAIENNCPSISYTYTEPTIFLEYALDTMKLAEENGLKNCWVSNGFMTGETLEMIAPYLDAINVDLKFFDNKLYREHCGGRLQPILDNLKVIKKLGIWLEITTLVIPTLSDSEKMFKQIAEFIKTELGPETPWHVSRFSGYLSWKLQNLPDTPTEKVETAYRIGKEAGLKYVYSGNIPLIGSENTFCPKCGVLNIERIGYHIKRHDKNGKCHQCGETLNLIPS
ncbi:MAG: AmmeMemoRadiSam system radical SAM enzyme [Candidatus Portnoybacteria bacterium]|nr:AmmeMemoRadiSam system radical SAM enzyme [Candidatus Portnoybacteria bacterium]